MADADGHIVGVGIIAMQTMLVQFSPTISRDWRRRYTAIAECNWREVSVARKAKTWAEKMNVPEPHIEVMEKAFAGIPAGTRMLISSPVEVADWLRKNLPYGQTMALPDLRFALAKARGAEATCPLTASIFLRIAAEAAWDELEAGASLGDIVPFWRAVDPKSDLARKLRCGPDWIAHQRQMEAA